MTAVLVRRTVRAVFVCLGVSAITFLLLHLSGDPALLLLSVETPAQEIVRFRETMGFNDPLYLQYVRFLGNVVRGDFGYSFYHKQSALSIVWERIPATVQLTVAGMLVAIFIAVPTGVLSALRRYTLPDYLATVAALLGQSTPVFWLGILLIYLFAVQLGWLPVSGRGGLAHLILPAVTLGAYLGPLLMRMVRSSMLEALDQEYIRTAYAKGLPQRIVVYKHALKNAAIPLVTIIGLQFGRLLGGAVITETVFAWPGVGRLTVIAIEKLDYPVVQAAVFTLAFFIVLANLAVDVAYSYLDPRIRVR